MSMLHFLLQYSGVLRIGKSTSATGKEVAELLETDREEFACSKPARTGYFENCIVAGAGRQ